MLQKFSVSLIFLLVLFVTVGAQRTIDGVRVGIINGMAKYLPKPDYPQEAKDFCVGGKVEILVELMASGGKPLSVKAISGDELLQNSAEDAVRKAIFYPRQELTKDYKIKGIVVYNFDALVSKCIVVGVVNKKALNTPKPVIANLNQPKHLQIKEEQIVAVQIVIDMNGKVIKARAISGHLMLRSACEYAARQAKFAPTIHPLPITIRALLVYKFKPDGTIDTDIERDDKTVIGTPINLVEPPPPFCNCKIGGTASVMVEAKTDEQGNVIESNAFAGVSFLRKTCEKAALESKFLPTNQKAKIILVYNFEMVGKYEILIKNIEVKKVEIEK